MTQRATRAVRRNVLITGASSGLGAGMARELAARGRNLGLCARRVDRLDELRAELLAAHPGITVAVAPLDVTDHPQVFEVFGRLRDELGSLDRVVVNAGVGKGQPLGTGRFDANAVTAQTNFVAALAQMEAALQIMRAQGTGHLVVVSSVSAVRGLPRNVTTYAATKAGVARLADGVRLELRGTGIRVTTLLPGWIRSEMTEGTRGKPFMVDGETGARALVQAMEREPARAYVPAWPWRVLAPALRVLPSALLSRMT